MNKAQLLVRMLRSGRLLKRGKLLSQYAYYHLLGAISSRLSLEHPRFRAEDIAAEPPPPDRTSSIELHLVSDANAQQEFDQPDERRRALVTAVPDKFHTATCFVCDSSLTPVIQVVNAIRPDDYIELSWCASCDYVQYSVMPSKSWISRWYASNWDSSGSIAEKLDTRPTTYRYYHRLAPFIGNRKLKILDIGAGYGEKIRAFALAGHEVHCTEATTRRAEFLREHVTRNVYLGTLDDPTVRESLRRNAPFDLIFTYHVVEHIYDARNELRILGEIAAEDALFYLAIPELYKEGILNNIYALEHISSFGRLAAKTLMKQSGFQTIIDKDDPFQYFSNYCQYLIGRKATPGTALLAEANVDPAKMGRYLSKALSLDRIASLRGSSFSYHYNNHVKLTYSMSEESKVKCRDPGAHLPIRIYHHGLPLFWMKS